MIHASFAVFSFGSAVWLIVLLIALACITVLLIALVFAVVIYRYRTKIARAERDGAL